MKIIIIGAIGILLAVQVQEYVLQIVAGFKMDLRLQAVLAATVIFAPAAIALGIVSPYVAKLRLTSMQTAGRSIGRLYAAGTIGSIAGTFLAGYWLIAFFGNRTLATLLVVVLVVVSFLAASRYWWWQRVLLAVIALLSLQMYQQNSRVTADIDSAYSRYQLIDRDYDGMKSRMLTTDKFSVQSWQVLGQPGVFPLGYIQSFESIRALKNPKSMAVIGGGIYTFPSHAASQMPDSLIDAVEIDPELNTIAREYFELKEYANMRIINQDGRTFLNQGDHGPYDVLYLDAFSSLTPPFHLVTREAAQLMKQSLTPGGLVVANLVAPVTDNPYLSAVHSTFSSVFSQVAAYKKSGVDPAYTQNIIFVMSTDSFDSALYERAISGTRVNPIEGVILTDDFAPVEQLIAH